MTAAECSAIKSGARLAEVARTLNHPRRLSARWLYLAGVYRKVADQGAEPGRGWWVSNARRLLTMSKVERLRWRPTPTTDTSPRAHA